MNNDKELKPDEQKSSNQTLSSDDLSRKKYHEAVDLAKAGDRQAIPMLLLFFDYLEDVASDARNIVVEILSENFQGNSEVISALEERLASAPDHNQFKEILYALASLDEKGETLPYTIMPYLADTDRIKRQSVAGLIVDYYIEEIDLDTIAHLEETYWYPEAQNIVRRWISL